MDVVTCQTKTKLVKDYSELQRLLQLEAVFTKLEKS